MFWRKNDNKFVVYISLIEEIYCHETVCSICSFFSLNPTFEGKIVIYTDNEDFFIKHLPNSEKIIILSIDKERINQLLSGSEYIFRLKILLLLDFSKQYSGKVLFADGDTFFIKNTNQLFKRINSKSFVLHCCEYKIESKINENYSSFFANRILKVNIKGRCFEFSEKNYMYNSGVVGFHTSNALFLELALALLDEFEWHKIQEKTLEQLALSLAFSKLKIKTADDTVFHYWFIKMYRMVLWQYFFKTKESITLNQSDMNFIADDFVKKTIATLPTSSRDFMNQIFLIVNHCYTATTKFNIKKNFDKKSYIYKKIN